MINAAKDKRVNQAMAAGADELPEPKPEKKRATPKPTPETEALRAMRNLRQLKERAANAHRAYQKTQNECVEESVKIESALTAEARAIVKKLDPGLLAADAEAGQ